MVRMCSQNHFKLFCILSSVLFLNWFGNTNSYPLEDDSSYGGDSHFPIEEQSRSEGAETPKKLGEMEFDVEVEETLPNSGEKAPEVVVVGQKDSSLDINGDNEEDFQVFTEIPVDLMDNPKMIGNIEFDIDVADKSKSLDNEKTKEIFVFPKNSDSKSIDRRTKNFKSKDVRNFDSNEDNEDDIDYGEDTGDYEESEGVNEPMERVLGNNSTNTVNTTDSVTTDTANTTDTSTWMGSTDSTNTLDPNASIDTTQPIGDTSETQETSSDSGDTSEPPTEEPKDKSDSIPPITPSQTSEPQNSGRVLPYILIAIVFIMCTVLGLVWGFTKYSSIKRSESEEEKRIVAAEQAAAKAGAAPPPPPPPSPEPSAPPSAPVAEVAKPDDKSKSNEPLIGSTGDDKTSGTTASLDDTSRSRSVEELDSGADSSPSSEANSEVLQKKSSDLSPIASEETITQSSPSSTSSATTSDSTSSSTSTPNTPKND